MKITELLARSLKATAGLVLFAVGVYLTIQANIGVSPWDVFTKGLSFHTPLTYGKINIVVAIIFLFIDMALKEKIGIGTVLDAFIVGATLDVLEASQILPMSENLVLSIVMLIAGLFIEAYSQYLYMSAGLCCGPRDAFLVAVGKRLRKIPIGYVNIGIQMTVMILGIFLGGPVGIGTIISVGGIGLIMQLVFNMLKFEPRDVTHLSIREMIKK